MTTDDYSFLNSLDTSSLESLLSSHPKTASLIPQRNQPFNEREYDQKRKAAKRAAERDIKIPAPRDAERRIQAEADPELWLRTYFPADFYELFTEDRRAMLDSIIAAAQYGGDQAIAAPRGEGKTSLAMHGALYLMVVGLCEFPVVIGKSQGKAQIELKAIKEKLQQSEEFTADYPEIGVPFEAVGAWSSRARMQTVGGKLTNIEIAADHIAFPTITREQLGPGWPEDIEPASNGQVIYSLGIDGPIRGTKFRGKRPTLAIIDDIEDREAAASDVLIGKNEEIIEQDIAGLGSGSERVSRAMLCTIQNRKCIAYQYTDAKLKPSWRGKRYRKMIQPPARMDLVEQYISMRRERGDDDPDAREAFRFWQENQATIEEGCEISNPQSYSKKLYHDGTPLELSAIQAYYNRVADWGEKAVATEIDNDPPAESGPQGAGLTAEIVSSRISGLARRQLPANTMALTAAIDLGKYSCHWVVAAWWRGAGGVIVDYGIAEVANTDKTIDNEASEPHIYKALLEWRDYLLNQQYTDTTGTVRSVDMVLVDSGTFTNAAYEFARQVRGVFHVSKGIGNYRPKNPSKTIKPGLHMHAAYQAAANVWLYEMDTDHWKQWVHERYLTPTFDEENMLRRGSLSIYAPEGNRKHLSYAQHIVAEELVSEFKEGKGVRTFWDRRNPNNHWLDATYMAAACTEALGISLIDVRGETAPEIKPRPQSAQQRPRQQQHGRFRTRQGGWIKGTGR